MINFQQIDRVLRVRIKADRKAGSLQKIKHFVFIGYSFKTKQALKSQSNKGFSMKTLPDKMLSFE